SDPTFTYLVSPSITGMAALSGVLSRTTGETAGQYDVLQNTLTDANNANYQITFVSAKFTIGRATQSTITVTTTSTTYKVSLTLATSGGDGEGSISYSLSENGAGCSISSGVLSVTGNVGTTCKVTATKAQSTNFNEASSVATTISITPRAVTIVADSLSKIYGATDPTLTYNVTSGSLATGETLSGTLTRATGEAVGTYLISQGTVTSANNTNYTVTFSGTNNFTIDKRSIGLRADNKTKEWDDPANPDPALTFSIASGSLVTGDTLAGSFSGALTRNAGEDWGTYAITQGTLTSANYDFAWTNGTFSITQKAQNALVLSAVSTSVNYNATTTLSTSGGAGTGTVTYTPTNGTGACTVSGSTLTATRAG
ncbi:MAG: MBG domain-containing protein, partial [Actinomycetota bacterium]